MKIFQIRILFVLTAASTIISSIMLLLFKWHLFPNEIDYSNLENFLVNKQWKELDQETTIIYQQIVSNHLREEGL